MDQLPQRKRKTKTPCSICFLNTTLCICSQIPRLDLKTKLCLVIHHRELKRTTNTGQLAIQSLINSEMRIRGLIDQPLDLSDLVNEQYQTLLFYPSENANNLTQEYIAQFKKPILLIVPDGNWRQASKVHYRHSELKDVPRVMIQKTNTENTYLRAESTDYGMATLQAIAEAMGIIENEQIKKQLMALYHIKLKNTLIGRGQLTK